MNARRIPRSLKFLLGLTVLIVGARLVLPYVLKDYVNGVLADDIDGYTGHIADLDLSLWRGAYQIQGLKLSRIEKKVPVPFISGRELDFSVAWKPLLLKGEVVGKLRLDGYKLNFVKGRTAETTQSGMEGEGWRKAIDALFPLEIEELRIVRSEVHFRDFSTKPDIDLVMKRVRARASNLTNTDDRSKTLVSDFTWASTLQKQGRLRVKGGFSLLREPLPFDVNLELEKVHLPEFSDFLRDYANFDVARGRLDLYAEAASVDGKIKGYVKPLVTHLEVLPPKNRKDDTATVTDLASGTINLLIRRYSKDQVGTKVPFEGRLDDPKIGVWTGVRNLFSHAFGSKPLPARTDNQIDVKDARKL